MNTKQMVVFWYAGLYITANLIRYAVEGVMTPLLASAATILLAALFFYTFRPHPAVSRKRVLWFVASPVVVIAVVVGVSAVVVSSLPTRIPVELIRFTGSKMDFLPDGSTLIDGNIYNSSDTRLMGVEIKYTIHDPDLRSRVIEDQTIRIDLFVPPGEMRPFQKPVRFRQAAEEGGLAGNVIYSQELVSAWRE